MRVIFPMDLRRLASAVLGSHLWIPDFASLHSPIKWDFILGVWDEPSPGWQGEASRREGPVLLGIQHQLPSLSSPLPIWQNRRIHKGRKGHLLSKGGEIRTYWTQSCFKCVLPTRRAQCGTTADPEPTIHLVQSWALVGVTDIGHRGTVAP